MVGISPELSADSGPTQTAIAVGWLIVVLMVWLFGHTIVGASRSVNKCKL